MVEAEIETGRCAQTLIAVTPHRRRHLKSGTHRTLVRILSHCYDESQHSVADQNVPQKLNQEHGSNDLVQRTEKEMSGNVELLGPESMKPQKSATQEVGVVDESDDANGFQEKMEQLESLLSMEGNEDFSNFEDVMTIDNIPGIDFQDLGSDLNVLMDEPKQISKGNEGNTPKLAASSLDQNPNGSDKVALLTNQEEHSITARSESVVQMTSGTHDLSLNSVLIGECSNQIEPNEHRNSLWKTGALDVEPIMHQKAVRPKTSASAEGAKESLVPISEFGVIKEPENFSQKVPEAIEFSLNKDAVAVASKLSEYNKHESSSGECNHVEVEYEMQQKDKELEKIVFTGRGMTSPNHTIDEDIEEGEVSGDDGMDDRSMDVLFPDTVVLEDMVDRKEHPCKEENEKDFGFKSLGVDMVEEDEIGKTGEEPTENIRTEGKGDAGASKKRKREPPSKEKKERKKEKDRKKRAAKNRELGIKKLKLQPVQKPKTVSYCRHYIKGRCHEGDKCKFSHDIVPLTKSKPCVHFARQSCMKGDNCPYDHQLSNYPCNNFKDNGFCIRGDRCMFSHKMPSKEGSQNSASKPEVKPPAVQSNSRSQQVSIGGASEQNVHALAYSMEIQSHDNTKQNVRGTVLRQPELATRGISFLSIAKSPLIRSSMSKQRCFATERNTGEKAGNEVDQSQLSSVQNSNGIVKKTPPDTTPKGINFLSFGKASSGDARDKNHVFRQTSPIVSEALQNLNGMLKANQPAASQGTSFNPLGKFSVASSSSDQSLNGMLQDIQPAASQGTRSNPFGKSLVGSCSSDQNLRGILQANQTAALQEISVNPFERSSVTRSFSDQNLKGIVQANQLAVLQGTSFNPFRRSSVASFSSDQNLNEIVKENERAVSLEAICNPFGKSLVSCSSSEKPADKPQSSSAVSLRLPPSPLNSGQSSDCMSSRFCKDTATSLQRGLFSTLAFAAKYKTQNMNQSIDSTVTQVNKKTRNSSISDRSE